MDCNEALDLLYLSYEGQITPSQQIALNAHRRTCFACSAKLNKAEKFQQLIRRVPQVTVPRGLESRILAHVSANAGIVTTPKPQAAFTLPRFAFPKLQLSFGGVLATGGVLAAAIAVFIVANGIITRLVPQNSGIVTASIQGQLQAEGPSVSGGVLTGQQTISSGETLRNVSPQAVTVAFTPNLSVRLSPDAQVQFGGVYEDRTGQLHVTGLRVNSGSALIRENLHRDAAPIHVATTLATFTPVGTVFQVAQAAGSSHLSVTRGKVVVHTAHKNFLVIAGKGVRIAADGGVLWDKPLKKKGAKAASKA